MEASAGVQLVDVDADEGGERQPAWRDAPACGNEEPVDPGVIKAAVLGPAERPEEDLGGVVEALEDSVGVEVEGLAAAVGGNAVGEVDAQPPTGQLADGDIGIGEYERRGEVPPERVAGEVDDVVGTPARAPGHPGRPGPARVEGADGVQLDMRAPRIDGGGELAKDGGLALERHSDPTAAKRDVDRANLMPARKPSVSVDRVLEQGHQILPCATSALASTSSMFANPLNAIARSRSARKPRRTSVTPSAPPSARPQM